MNGRTGIIKCGNTSDSTTKEPFASVGSFTMAMKLTGRCACGSIGYQLLDKPMFVHCCHCDDCQRLTGSAFVLNAIVETQAVKLLRGKPVAVPVPRENGPHDIYRCPKCQRSSGTAASRITSTTGALKADTNGPTGIIRCGNTSASTIRRYAW